MSARSRAHPWFASDPHRIAQRQEEEREKLAEFWEALPKIEWVELPAKPGPSISRQFPKPPRPRARRARMAAADRSFERWLFAIYCAAIVLMVVGSCLGWWHVRGCER